MSVVEDKGTQKCRFMDKKVREISRFFVAPPRARFPSPSGAASRTSLPRIGIGFFWVVLAEGPLQQFTTA